MRELLHQRELAAAIHLPLLKPPPVAKRVLAVPSAFRITEGILLFLLFVYAYALFWGIIYFFRLWNEKYGRRIILHYYSINS